MHVTAAQTQSSTITAASIPITIGSVLLLSPSGDVDCASEPVGVDSVVDLVVGDGAGEEGSLGGESSGGGVAGLSDAHAVPSVAPRQIFIWAEYALSSSSHWHPLSWTYVM